MNDKRSVATDALDTLGTKVLPAGSGRDAIHLAVEPVTSDETLYPGQHIGVVDGKASTLVEKIGIVDPFISGPIYPGESFWFVVYPRTITSLRHVWSHPSFPETSAEPVAVKPPKPSVDKVAAVEYLKEYVNGYDYYDSNRDPIDLMRRCTEFAENALSQDGDEYFIVYGNDASGNIPFEFWDHVYALTGRRPKNPPQWFSCSC